MPTRREFFIASSAAAAGAAIAASPKLVQSAGNRDVPASRTSNFKIIALEEHVAIPQLQAAWSRVPGLFLGPSLGFGDEPSAQRLRDVGARRLADMDEQGVDMQVLAQSTPGVQNLQPAESVAVSREANDALADIVKARPDRFQAFASIPTPAPESAAAELERAVNKLGFCGAMLYGRTGNIKPEAREYDDLYATATKLRVPLYFHPQRPVLPVIDAYYNGIRDGFDQSFATSGLGWYYDLGVQLLRMIFTGVFDRHPDLQIIVGHWGEVVLFYLDHISFLTGNANIKRPLIDYFRQNIWITGSGTQSERYLRWTAEVVGVERMLYSTDYPFTFGTGDQFIETSKGRARSFLDNSSFTLEQKTAIASGNWQRLIAPVTNAFG
ncbi:amidohydrolase family protein [Nostoc sp. MG11]|uniref:amidohydrolase family protein n=1 Tax=Nostoc sp. MG11 TaxID=2721166 RepID=UPI0018681B80|nr:amidohydrolase family protein [Nostoc sp. MG11]